MVSPASGSARTSFSLKRFFSSVFLLNSILFCSLSFSGAQYAWGFLLHSKYNSSTIDRAQCHWATVDVWSVRVSCSTHHMRTLFVSHCICMCACVCGCHRWRRRNKKIIIISKCLGLMKTAATIYFQAYCNLHVFVSVVGRYHFLCHLFIEMRGSTECDLARTTRSAAVLP